MIMLTSFSNIPNCHLAQPVFFDDSSSATMHDQLFIVCLIIDDVDKLVVIDDGVDAVEKVTNTAAKGTQSYFVEIIGDSNNVIEAGAFSLALYEVSLN